MDNNDLRNIFGELDDSKNNEIDFSLRYQTEKDVFGPKVQVIKTLFNGDVEKEMMPVAIAMFCVSGYNGYNGRIYKSARINFMGVFDEWGQSM